MAWFLVILFLSASAPGGVEMREGWGPLPQADLQTCNESVVRLMAYLESFRAEAVVYCERRKVTR